MLGLRANGKGKFFLFRGEVIELTHQFRRSGKRAGPATGGRCCPPWMGQGDLLWGMQRGPGEKARQVDSGKGRTQLLCRKAGETRCEVASPCVPWSFAPQAVSGP